MNAIDEGMELKKIQLAIEWLRDTHSESTETYQKLDEIVDLLKNLQFKHQHMNAIDKGIELKQIQLATECLRNMHPESTEMYQKLDEIVDLIENLQYS